MGQTTNRLTNIDNKSDKWQGGSKRAYMSESRENGFGDRFLGAMINSSCLIQVYKYTNSEKSYDSEVE